MPLVTYCHDNDVTFHRQELNDAELQELLDDVNSISGESWFIRKTPILVRPWFSFTPRVTGYYYQLLSHIGGPEWQIINLAQRDNHTTTNRQDIINFFMGYMNGITTGKRLANNSTQSSVNPGL